MKGWRVDPVDGVDVTYQWQGWELWASWPQRTRRHDIITLIRIRYTGAEGPGLVLSTTRVNILSASAVASLITAMNKVVQPNPVAPFVHHVCEDLLGWYRRGAPTTYPAPEQRASGNGWLVYPIWPATGATVIGAAPSSYKSLMAQALALQLVTGTEVLAVNTRAPKPRKVLYLDWEADEGTFSQRLYGLCKGAGLELNDYLAYKLMRAPLVDAAVGLAEEVTRDGYDAVVIDSMSASVGGAMVDDDIVNAFWDATRILTVPTLVVAHKSIENIKRRTARVFGSVMSEVRVRLAWNAERAKGSSHVVWECFKDNNYGRLGSRLAWEIQLETQGSDEDQQLASIVLQGVKPVDVRIKADEGQTTADRMAMALIEHGPQLAAELADIVGASSGTIRMTTGRHPELFRKLPDGRWSVNTESDSDK